MSQCRSIEYHFLLETWDTSSFSFYYFIVENTSHVSQRMKMGVWGQLTTAMQWDLRLSWAGQMIPPLTVGKSSDKRPKKKVGRIAGDLTQFLKIPAVSREQRPWSTLSPLPRLAPALPRLNFHPPASHAKRWWEKWKRENLPFVRKSVFMKNIISEA